MMVRFECPRCGQVLEFESDGQMDKETVSIANESGTRSMQFCPDCAWEHGGWTWDSCQDCGEVVFMDEGDSIEDREGWIRGGNGFPICPECARDYVLCDRCEEWTHNTELVDVYDYSLSHPGQQWCRECAENNSVECECCDRQIANNCESLESADNLTVCVSCYDDYYTRCSSCGDIVSQDCNQDEDGDPLCETCWNEARRAAINDYHTSFPTHFHRVNGEPEGNMPDGLYLGLEMECDDESEEVDVRWIASKLHENLDRNNEYKYMHIEHDGSLQNGFEVIWQPMTLRYLWDEGGKMIGDSAQWLIQQDMRADKTDTCGAHIHASRCYFGATYEEQQQVLDKMAYLAHRHYKHMLNFCRRSDSSCSRWAKVNVDIVRELEVSESDSGDELRDTEYAMKKGQDGNNFLASDRYCFFNVCTRGHRTVEWRAPKGSLNPKTIMANFEFYWGFINMCKNTDWKQIYKMDHRAMFLDVLKRVVDYKLETANDNTCDLEGYLVKRGLI